MLFGLNMFSQNYTNIFYYNLMDDKTYDYIVGESSGDLSYYQILDLAGYEKNRTNEQYKTLLHESQYILDKMNEYGLAGATVERLGRTKTWDGISASLWEVSPKLSKIADYNDLAASLGSGSKNANVEAELIWVGKGSPKDLHGLNLQGKIAVTDASPSRVHDAVVAKGAIGIISFSSPRPLLDPIQVPNTGIRGDNATFCFNLPPRDGYVLRDRLLQGEKIKVKAKVETQQVELDIQVPTCYIQGADKDAEEVIFVAHLYEGYVKLGANDNTSGCTAMLDIARTINTLINNGSIERPKRTMRFIWAPEFSGTGPWVKAHKDITDKALCALNMDMVGLWLSKSNSFYTLNRTTMGNPHYINDVAEAFFHYMSMTNKEWTGTGVGRPLPSKPVYSMTGSRDPFYYSINHHYGASDHEVFNDWGVQVPSIITITWTDNYYHTSGDRPSIIDPTQMKRATVLSAAIGYYIANANDADALKIAGEVAGNGSKRLALYQNRGVNAINNADKNNLVDIYKKACNDIDALKINEIETVNSVSELAPINKSLNSYITSVNKDFIMSVNNAKSVLDRTFKTKAALLGVVIPKKIELTQDEIKASKLFPKTSHKVLESGYGVTRAITPELKEKYNINLPNSGEASKLTVQGDKSILDIKKMLEAQFPQQIDINELIRYYEMLQEVGLVNIN